MGHYAEKFASKAGSEQQQFFLNTGDASSFARKLHCDFPSQEKVSFLSQTKGLSLNKNMCGHIYVVLEKGHSHPTCPVGDSPGTETASAFLPLYFYGRE